MGEYGSGVSMAQAFAYDKERIKKAPENKIMAGEDEGGFIYRSATDEEARSFILQAFDNAVYLCFRMNANANAMEKMLEHYHDKKQIPPGEGTRFKDYLHFIEAEDRKVFGDRTYPFEPLPDDEEETGED